MKIPKSILFFLLIAVCSCNQKSPRSKGDVNVARLSNKIIPLIKFLDNPDSCKKALLFLDSATAIDGNCFLCYNNKLMFLNSLKQFNRMLSTLDTCIKLKPNAHDLYLNAGILHEKVGDTGASKSYFTKSLQICNSVLDTMQTNNRDYAMVITNKAINLIMLDDSATAHEILNKLYKTQPDDPQFDNFEKKYTLSLMNKSKALLIDSLTNSENFGH